MSESPRRVIFGYPNMSSFRLEWDEDLKMSRSNAPAGYYESFDGILKPRIPMVQVHIEGPFCFWGKEHFAEEYFTKSGYGVVNE
jgi:hypothetical protein